MRFAWFPFFILLVVAQSGLAQSLVPFMNLMDYRQRLIDARGGLPPQSICAMDLRVRLSLRDQILNQGHDFNWLMDSNRYPPADQAEDKIWTQAHGQRTQEEKNKILVSLKGEGINSSPWEIPANPQATAELAKFGFYPGFYNPQFFSSYQVGPAAVPWFKPDGYVYKVFFEFTNPQQDLTPQRYNEFSRRLWVAGFHGDSKIPMLKGWIRFTWNNIIVHAPTTADALIAEQVGLNYFAPLLSSYSRGVDVANSLTGGQTTDWPDFLCTVDPRLLPSTVLQYLKP
jgi:hypothetical protein